MDETPSNEEDNEKQEKEKLEELEKINEKSTWLPKRIP